MTFRLLLCIVVLLPLRAVAEPLVVFAAASLRGALDEIVAGYDGEVVVSYGGSGAMAQQIARGAPADIYLSANVAWVDWLDEQGIGGQRVDLLSNRLVIVVPEPRPALPLYDLPQGTIAIGQVDSVPAGQYAREAFISLGQWQDVSGRVIQTQSVTAALRLVLLGEVDAAVVYASDAMGSPELFVWSEFPAGSHSRILYPAVALTDRGDAFAQHLVHPQASAVFAAHGFVVLANQ